MLVLSDSDLKKALPMSSAIVAMRKAFIELSSGKAIIPTRLTLDAKEHSYVGLFMPAFSPSLERSAIKIVSINDDGPKQGLPLIRATVVLNSSLTGETLCTMNGDQITAIRTAAGAGLATDLLAIPDSKVLGIIGTGTLARTHLSAMLEVRAIEKVWVKGRRPESSQRFIEEMRSMYSIDISLTNCDEDLKSCDVICTVTSSYDPVLSLENVKSTAHINAMGSYRPMTREIEEDLILASTIIVDETEAALTEPGDLILPIQAGKLSAEDIYAELGELAGNTKPLPGANKISLFKSVGNGVQDIYAADLAYSNAIKDGLGTVVEMD